MTLKRIPYLLVAIAMWSACATNAPPSTDSAPGSVTRQLIDLGFAAVANADVTPAAAPPDESAVLFRNPDGRSALLIHDNAGAEKTGVVFDAAGKFQLELTPTGEAAYCYRCDVGYWVCTGSCVTPCWYDWGLGQGCYSDCTNACDWYEWNICDPEYCYI